MQKCYSTLLKSSSAAEIDTQAELQQQASLLKCLQLRSQAVEARLRNEINLVCTGHRLIICSLIICMNYCVGLYSCYGGLCRQKKLINKQAFNLVAQYDSRSAVQISTNTATDSAAMKTISVLGLVFLPGTFICVCSALPLSFSPLFSFAPFYPPFDHSRSRNRSRPLFNLNHSQTKLTAIPQKGNIQHHILQLHPRNPIPRRVTTLDHLLRILDLLCCSYPRDITHNSFLVSLDLDII
jgi:hypothetical protein